jgi:hypothetical protein
MNPLSVITNSICVRLKVCFATRRSGAATPFRAPEVPSMPALKRKSLLFALLALSASLALAAKIPFASKSPGGKEFYGGYSYSFRDYAHNQDNPLTGGMNGWQGSFKVPILPLIGLKADASGFYRNDTSSKPQIYFVMAGPEIGKRIGRYKAFVHGLVGFSHLNGGQSTFPLASNISFAAAVGGGLDVSINRLLAWRVTGDFLHSNFTPGGQETNQLHDLVSSNGRASTGLVLRF